MENNELKFYWYPNNDIDGVNFEMDKEYVISEINRLLNENYSRKINGFFIHFRIQVEDDRFNRIIIERGTKNNFKFTEQTFSKEGYYHKSSNPTVEFASFDECFKTRSGSNMLRRFGLFDKK